VPVFDNSGFEIDNEDVVSVDADGFIADDDRFISFTKMFSLK